MRSVTRARASTEARAVETVTQSPCRMWISRASSGEISQKSSGASSVADVGVLGASGYAGALAAQLIERHPFFELAYVTARSDAGCSVSR